MLPGGIFEATDFWWRQRREAPDGAAGAKNAAPNRISG
jgi:hypothetical protein